MIAYDTVVRHRMAKKLTRVRADGKQSLARTHAPSVGRMSEILYTEHFGSFFIWMILTL